MAILFGVLLAISIVPASSNVIKPWDARHASLFSSENAELEARDIPDTNVVLTPVARSHLLPDQIEETVSTGSEQARLAPRDQATVKISHGEVKTITERDSNSPLALNELIDSVSEKESAIDLPPRSAQNGTKDEPLASTSIKADGALARPTDTAADAESSALPTSPPKGAIVPPPPVLGTGGEHTLNPLELRAVAADPTPTNHPTLVTIHANTKREAAAVATDLEPLEPRAVTSKIVVPIPTNHPTLVTIHAATVHAAANQEAVPIPTNHPTLVTIHAATNREALPIPTNHPTLVTIHAATNREAVPIPTSKPAIATVYASHGATGIPITAQRQVYVTYSSITTCEYSPATTVPFIATAPPPPLQAECRTHLSPVVTSYCSTSVPQMAAANITVTDCNQQITYATTNGYSIVSSNRTIDSGNGATGNAPPYAPAIQTLTTYSAAVWDAITPGSTPTAGERVVCTQDGGCSTTRFFMGAVVTNGSTPTHPPYTLANSTGTPPNTLANSTAGHFTVPAPFARGTGSYTVPIGTATGSSLARAVNSTAPTFQWLNTATTTPQARVAATSAPLAGQQPDAAGGGDFWGVPAPATTSSVIDIGS